MTGRLVQGVGLRCACTATARDWSTRDARTAMRASCPSCLSCLSTVARAPSVSGVLDPPPGSWTHWTHGGGSNKRLFFRGGPTGPTGPTPSRTRPHAREAILPSLPSPKFLPASPARRVQRVQRVQGYFYGVTVDPPAGPKRGGVGPGRIWKRLSVPTRGAQEGALPSSPRRFRSAVVGGPGRERPRRRTPASPLQDARQCPRRGLDGRRGVRGTRRGKAELTWRRE